MASGKRGRGRFQALADYIPCIRTNSKSPTPCSEEMPQYMWPVVLGVIVSIICSIDRTAMSVAIMPMSEQYSWNSSAKGAIASAFNWGHMITNVLGGYMAAVMSPKDVLSLGVIVWSAFTIFTPWAAATRWMPLLLFVRAVMGLGEGVAFPTMQAIIKGWVPADKRSRSLSAIYSGHQIGSILSLLFSPLLLERGGVDVMFVVYGTAGFVWLALWHPLISPTPTIAHGGKGSPASGALPQHHSGGAAGGGGNGGAFPPLRLKDVPFSAFLRSKVVWGITVAHSTFGLTYNIIIAWLPTYYAEVFGLDVRASSFLSIAPWAAMAVGTNLSGWVADTLINRKILTPTLTRKALQVVGCGGPALCLAYLGLSPQGGRLGEAVAVLTLALGTLGMQAGGFASNHQDIATRYAPVLYGATNAAASLAGSAGVYVVGRVLDATGSWSMVLVMVSVANAVSAATYAAVASCDPLFE